MRNTCLYLSLCIDVSSSNHWSCALDQKLMFLCHNLPISPLECVFVCACVCVCVCVCARAYAHASVLACMRVCMHVCETGLSRMLD